MDEWLQTIQAHSGVESLALIFGASAAEYVVPPLPADTIVVASAVLVVAGSWSFATVWTSVVLGGLLGAYLQYALGRILADGKGGFRGEAWIRRLFGDKSIDEFVVAFHRHGYWVIAVNRFMPGLRAGVFLMAGALGLRLGRVLFLGLLSGIAWSTLLLILGITIGENFEKIQSFLIVYRTSVGGIMIALIGVFAYRKWTRGHKERP